MHDHKHLMRDSAVTVMPQRMKIPIQVHSVYYLPIFITGDIKQRWRREMQLSLKKGWPDVHMELSLPSIHGIIIRDTSSAF